MFDKAVSVLMDRARAKAQDGVILAETFGEILRSFKREEWYEVEPPSGLANSIHILVIHGGFVRTVLPVLHCLGERSKTSPKSVYRINTLEH